MESLGEKLRNTRNEKGLSLDQISRETNISIRFLEALETENFSVFPGEPYVIGFLKNYGTYLDLDPQKVISLYRSLRIQEQPVPVEQLLRRTPQIPKFVLPLILILLAVGASGYGIYKLILSRLNRVTETVQEVRAPSEYIMEINTMEKRLYKNDTVIIPIDNEMYKLELYNLGETVTLRTPEGSRSLDLGQDITIDLNNDGIPELRITVADFEKNKAEMGALLHFSLMDAEVFTGTEITAPQPSVNTAGSITIIQPSPSAYPFTLQITFQGYCMFRWEILREMDRRGTNQRYFQRGEQLDIQAQNGIRIWASNAQIARFLVIGGGRTFPVELGAPGEVVVADFTWVRDEDQRSRLVISRLEAN